MKICITGSEGFVGRYVTNKYLACKHQVLGIDDLSKYNKRAMIDDVYSQYFFLRKDARNVSEEIIYYQPDIIIDLAEDVGGINYLNKNSFEKLSSSMSLRHHLLSLAREINSFYVCISSSCIYENTKLFPTPEIPLSMLSMPNSPYAFTKINAELLTKESGAKYVIARLFNVAGIGDDDNEKGHVISQLVKKFKKGKYEIYGGTQIRNFTHGSDIAKAIYMIANPIYNGETFNIGSSSKNTISIFDLAQMILSLMKKKEIISMKKTGLFDIVRSEPDITKLSLLGYKEEVNLRSIIEEAINYYE